MRAGDPGNAVQITSVQLLFTWAWGRISWHEETAAFRKGNFLNTKPSGSERVK